MDSASHRFIPEALVTTPNAASAHMANLNLITNIRHYVQDLVK
jgi:hypothetical protein